MRAAVCLIGSLGALSVGGIGWLLFLSAVSGALTTQAWIAREGILPQLFPGQRLEKILSATTLADQLGMVLGPLVAALMLAWMPWEYAVGATALLFLLADQILLLWWQQAKPVVADPIHAAGPWYQPLRIAFGHIHRLPGLKMTIFLAVGVNLVLGVTLATAAALVTGALAQSDENYALLQTAGAAVTVLILTIIARKPIPVGFMGGLAYGMIALGGFLTGIAQHPAVYAIGFLLIIGFDKMFAVYMRSLRQRLIPAQDFGKTTGVIVLLNNLSQPLAGALVGFTAGPEEARLLILTITACVFLSGSAALVAVRRAVKT